MTVGLRDPFKVVFIIWSVLSLFIIPYMSRNASITEDEFEHRDHGHRLLDYYEGRSNAAIKSPVDSLGNMTVKTDLNSALNVFGGFFDLSSTFLYEHFFHNVIGEFEFRHIMSSLFGAALLIFTGLICFQLSQSWAVALLGLIIASFTPRLIGNSLSNPKDIPLATFSAFTLLQIIAFLRELPRVKIGRALLLIIGFMLATNIRASGGIALVGYFLMFTTIYIAYMVYDGQLQIKRAWRIMAFTVGVAITGYICTGLLWPWDFQNPILNPYKAFKVFSNFDYFNSLGLFEGRWLLGNHIPWYFVPQWLYITLPISVIGGLVLFCVLLPGYIRSSWFNKVATSMLLLSVVLPLTFIIINKSNIYDGARQVLFVVPSLIVLATLGWARLFENIHAPYLKITVGALLFLILLEPAIFIFRNNPVQAMYFSPLIGGTKGAFKNFEMDYYGYSVKPALDWIEKNDTMYKTGHKARVRLWYGEQGKIKYYLDKDTHLQYALCEENSTDWDYSIQMPAEAKFYPDIIYHWPPKGTVYEVMADSAPLCAVIRNWRIPEAQTAILNAAPGAPSDLSNAYIQNGLSYYNAKDYNKAVIEFKKAVNADAKNSVAYNDLVACYNQLKMFDAAITYAKLGLSITPDMQILKNNLNETLKAKQNWNYNGDYYLNLSLNYYLQEDYINCINAAKMALKYDPKNAIAWNNICSAYNVLKEYQKAMEACKEGMKLDANNKLLQGNLNVSLNGLKK